MINFREWLKLDEEGKGGFVKARPNASDVINRTQLWGPSAHFGRADAMLPHQKIAPAILGGIGKGVLDALGRTPEPSRHLEPMPRKADTVDLWGMLPLQMPAERISMNKKNILKIVADIVGDPERDNRVRHPGDDGESVIKFRIPNPDKPEELEAAEMFTLGLIYLSFYNQMKHKGILDTVNWQKPEWSINHQNGNLEVLGRFQKNQQNDWEKVGTKNIYGKDYDGDRTDGPDFNRKGQLNNFNNPYVTSTNPGQNH